MKNLFTKISLLLLGVLLLGFVFIDNNPFGSRTITTNTGDQVQPIKNYTNNPPVYTDDFDGANDTTSLKARGYLVWYRGGGPQGLTATWYQGVPVALGGPFDAYNGPTSGYVSANYNVVTGTNNIDSWLVLPRLATGITAGDTLYYFSRSATGSIYPDSIRVMYSVSDSVPEGTWTELGRYKTNTTTGWELRGFRAPTTSINGRFAIRYCVVGGGPGGSNSDYIGIDAMSIVSSPSGIVKNSNQVPNSYKLDQNYPNPFNPTTKISFALPKSGNVELKVYNILGKEVAVLVNEYQTAGSYTLDFNASSIASGVYFYTLKSGSFVDSKKMVVLK